MSAPTETELVESILAGMKLLAEHPGFTERVSKDCWHEDEPCSCLRYALAEIDELLWQKIIGADEELTRAANRF